MTVNKKPPSRSGTVSPLDSLDLRIRELADLPDGWYVSPDGERSGKTPSWKALMALRRFALAWMPDDMEDDVVPDVEGGASLFYDGDRDVARVRFRNDGSVVAEVRDGLRPVDMADVPQAAREVFDLLNRRKV